MDDTSTTTLVPPHARSLRARSCWPSRCLLWLSDRFGWLGWHKGYAVLTGVAGGVAMRCWVGSPSACSLACDFT